MEENYRAKEPGAWDSILDWVESIAFAVVTVILLFTFVFRIVGVIGGSMIPTLQEGDRLIVQEAFYQPQVGDVVVLNKENFSEKPFVKRIIAMEGQTVDIDFELGIVYVDGQALEEDYVNELTYRQEDISFPLTVPEGQLFVMGDNRNASTDSRSSLIGLVDERNVVGKAILRIYPFSSIGLIKH
jgi:signal peptidase I